MQRATSAFLITSSRISPVRQLGSTLRTALSTPASQSPFALRATNGSSTKTMAMALTATCQFRGYASKKDAKKGGKGAKGGKKGSNSDEDDDDSGSRKGKSSGSSAGADMSFDPVELENKMGQCLERLKKDFMTMRAGTANPAILDPVRVKVDNKIVPLRDLAQISIKDAKTLMVNVSDVELIVTVEKAIREAGLNLNPIADNKAVRVPVPKPTKEFRETLTKQASASTEKAKTIIRKLRQDGMKELKKDLKAGMSEDENFTLEKKAQTLHDKYIKDSEDALKAKTKEIMAN
ncbi:hypothetical protein BG011_009859 [Mortierella polycephala]|uniref:Ribosome recycling factor domain-containing protein n=1 Tax=Mortierella polycephala TaxID=41804 RepID=A0A9P6PMQ2_9FUNG|nr:hypothetical protein BG011_009859 [Mortierella polycephala]